MSRRVVLPLLLTLLMIVPLVVAQDPPPTETATPMETATETVTSINLETVTETATSIPSETASVTNTDIGIETAVPTVVETTPPFEAIPLTTIPTLASPNTSILVAQAQLLSGSSYVGTTYAIIAPADVDVLYNLAVTGGCSLSVPYDIYLTNGVYTVTSPILFLCNTRIYGRGVQFTFLELDATAPNDDESIFEVTPGVTLDLHNLTVRNGRALNGGAGIIWGNARLNIYDSRFENNVVPDGGGAIYIGENGFLFTRRSEFRNNAAEIGGAIFSIRSIDIPPLLQLDAACTLFQANSATATENGWAGGAIGSTNSYAVITNSNFTSNIANSGLALFHHVQPILGEINAAGNYWFNPIVDASATNYGVNTTAQLTLPPNCPMNAPIPVPGSSTSTPTPTPTRTPTATATATLLPACIVVSRTTMTRTEGQGGQNYNVSLSRAPATGETVTIRPSTTSNQFTISPAQRTRNSSNWNAGVSFSVTAINDTVFELTQTGIITHSSTSSRAGSAFNGAIGCQNITVTVLDNDPTPTPSPTLTITPTATATPNSCTSRTNFGDVLRAETLNDEICVPDIDCSDGSISIIPAIRYQGYKLNNPASVQELEDMRVINPVTFYGILPLTNPLLNARYYGTIFEYFLWGDQLRVFARIEFPQVVNEMTDRQIWYQVGFVRDSVPKGWIPARYDGLNYVEGFTSPGNIDPCAGVSGIVTPTSLTFNYNRRAAANYAIEHAYDFSLNINVPVPVATLAPQHVTRPINDIPYADFTYSNLTGFVGGTGSAVFLSEAIWIGGMPMIFGDRQWSCRDEVPINISEGWRYCRFDPAPPGVYDSPSNPWDYHQQLLHYFTNASVPDTQYSFQSALLLTGSNVGNALSFNGCGTVQTDRISSGNPPNVIAEEQDLESYMRGQNERSGEVIDSFGLAAFVTSVLGCNGQNLQRGDYIYINPQDNDNLSNVEAVEDGHGLLVLGWGPIVNCLDAWNTRYTVNSFTQTALTGDVVPYVADFTTAQPTTPRPFYCTMAYDDGSTGDYFYRHDWFFFRLPDSVTVPVNEIYVDIYWNWGELE